jgi:hypothetical protein
MADSDVMTTSQREIKFREEQGAFPSCTWECTCGGNFMADSDVMTTSQREIKFHEEQGAFPNEIWERGKKFHRGTAGCLALRGARGLPGYDDAGNAGWRK